MRRASSSSAGTTSRCSSSAIKALKPNGITVVILMGFGRRAELTAQLIAAGWDAATPAAIVSDGTLPTQQTWRGMLGGCGDGTCQPGDRRPGRDRDRCSGGACARRDCDRGCLRLAMEPAVGGYGERTWIRKRSCINGACARPPAADVNGAGSSHNDGGSTQSTGENVAAGAWAGR